MLPLVVLEQADPSVNEANDSICFATLGTAAGVDSGIHVAHTIRASPSGSFFRHVPHPALDARLVSDPTAVGAKSEPLVLPSHLRFLANFARVVPVTLGRFFSLPARRFFDLLIHVLWRHTRP